LQGLPSTYPDGRLISSTQRDTQRTLHALSRVTRAFYAAARPLLFRRLQITLPFSFLLLLRTLGAAHLADAYEEHARLRRPSRADTGELEGSSTEEETGDEKELPVALPSIVPPAADELGDVPMASPAPRRKRGAEMSFSAMVAAAGFARATGSRLVVPRGARERLGDIQADEDEAGMQLIWTGELAPRMATRELPSIGRLPTDACSSQSKWAARTPSRWRVRPVVRTTTRASCPLSRTRHKACAARWPTARRAS
jgi:hypothetical protein